MDDKWFVWPQKSENIYTLKNGKVLFLLLEMLVKITSKQACGNILMQIVFYNTRILIFAF
jgi:hypothetical protein